MASSFQCRIQGGYRGSVNRDTERLHAEKRGRFLGLLWMLYQRYAGAGKPEGTNLLGNLR